MSFYLAAFEKEAFILAKKSISQDKLETAFIDYLKEVTPKEEFLGLFKEVICDVWKEQYAALNRDYTVLQKRLSELKDQKINLITMKSKGLLEDEDFVHSLSLIKQKIDTVKIQVSTTDTKEYNVDEAIKHCFSLIKDVPEYWRQASFDTKLKIQKLIFPKGVSYGSLKFKTPEMSLIYNVNETSCDDKNDLVDQVCERWNHIIADLYKWEEFAKRVKLEKEVINVPTTTG